MKILIILMITTRMAYAQFETDDIEEAPYTRTNIGNNIGYEERFYGEAKWVCHNNTKDVGLSSSQRVSFFALFEYILGGNQQGMKIPMTAPVTMLRDALGDGTKVFQMCFYLPAAHQTAPPQPTNEEVFLQNRPSMTVLTRTFGGFANRDSVWDAEANSLKEVLKTAGETDVDFSSFYRVGYDSPMKFENRRNEVWFLKKK